MVGHAVGIGKMHRTIGTCRADQFKENEVFNSLANGIAEGVLKYADYYSKKLSELCVIVVREDGGSVNFSDQKRVEIALRERLNFQVEIFREGFRELSNLLKFG